MADLIVSGLISAKPLPNSAADSAQIKKIKQTAQDFEAVLMRWQQCRLFEFGRRAIGQQHGGPRRFWLWQSHGPANDSASSSSAVNQLCCQCRKALSTSEPFSENSSPLRQRHGRTPVRSVGHVGHLPKRHRIFC